MAKPATATTSARIRRPSGASTFSGAIGCLVLFFSFDGALAQGEGEQQDATSRVFVRCQIDQQCQDAVGPASTCSFNHEQGGGGGVCTENRYRNGCLHNLFPDKFEPRVCNSDDLVAAAALHKHGQAAAAQVAGCRLPDIGDYGEVRIFTNNWESSLFSAWVLQIILSELLGVPTTLETGSSEGRVTLYQADTSLQFGNANDIEALTVAAENGNGDCTIWSGATAADGGDDDDNEQEYTGCAHLIPEHWDSTGPRVTDGVYKGTLEPPQSLGALGMEAWFVTKFTVEKDPSLATYMGLQGDDKRRLLADTFLRPTTWGDYCAQVSLTACRSDDGVATRPPETEEEENRMFAQGLYTGHFRKTDENDCDRFPHNCTGHIADYPCGWSSFVESQAYHLGIPMQSSGPEPGSRGYGYSQLTEIMRAANATKSNAMIFWWTPEPLYQSFQGTDSEFIRVNLPSPTQECIRARTLPVERCSEVLEDRVGLPEGACDESAKPLEKIISTGLYDMVFDPSIPDATRNPGHDVLRNFKLSELQLAEMFQYWKREPDLRSAICMWGEYDERCFYYFCVSTVRYL